MWLVQWHQSRIKPWLGGGKLHLNAGQVWYLSRFAKQGLHIGQMRAAREMIQVDVRNLVFPLIAGVWRPDGFERRGYAGTGFFVGRRGLALTASHVVSSSGSEFAAALPGAEKPLSAHKIRWQTALPNCDITVMRVDVDTSSCFQVRFAPIHMGENVETTAIPESMLVTDVEGRTQIMMRCAKGYVSYGTTTEVFASFALPKGMSGAPLIVTSDKTQYVAGVCVGQQRGEQIEDSIEQVAEEVGGERRVETERISRVEYFAKGDLLHEHRLTRRDEFEGLTLEELIARDIAD